MRDSQLVGSTLVASFGIRWRQLADPVRMARSDPHLPGTKLSLQSFDHVRVTVIRKREQGNRLRFQLHHRHGEVSGHPDGCHTSAATPPPAEFETHALRALETFRSRTLRDGYGLAGLSLPRSLCRRDGFRPEPRAATAQPHGKECEECSPFAPSRSHAGSSDNTPPCRKNREKGGPPVRGFLA